MTRLFVFFCLFCQILSAYQKPLEVSDEDWNKGKPYFLPENHKIKPKVDKLFSASRRPTFLTAIAILEGFDILRINTRSGLTILKHPDLKGYVFKVIPDNFLWAGEIHNFVKRVEGANAIQEAINRLGWTKEFKAVKKWIYPLPIDKNILPKGFVRKYFILIAEEAHIPSNIKHELIWKSKLITKDKLLKFYHLVSALGLCDSLFIDNTPFTTDGKITFIDTENIYDWNINWGKLLRVLSPEMQIFWNEITPH